MRVSLNSYAVLDFFSVLLRLLLALAVLLLAVAFHRRLPFESSPERIKTQEERFYLLFSLSWVLVILNVVSWPLLYLVLQSFIPEWPQAMCIYGIMQIGAGSEGVSRFLPGLITTLQFAKPALVFISGAWFVLYLVNRQSTMAPLTGRLVVILMILGLLSAGDALIEGLYLAIPKREVFLSTGCCTSTAAEDSRATRFLPQAMFGSQYRPWLNRAYYGVNLAMVLGLAFFGVRAPHTGVRRALPWLVAGALISLAVNCTFLTEIAAPVLLHRPHHCPYDLLGEVPESVVGVVFFVLGCFAVGWAACVAWIATPCARTPFLAATIRNVLSLALFCYVASLVIMLMELSLA